ncbi:endoglucanase [Actinopolymorpha cephalotaxi]|uniref:Glucanase n=1 Tax=Actinopolymorpha cephalotaxi TaxID=504797 RepID=A0A1I2UAU9_9ACTN|nr:glycoside hydrolase family 6 protein [Actinopolymorpha cephalotaxi]NYH86513.1 endoglucanase [Actinopolymorpha cephalotaxi]SFG74262.1 endoglucanase [Actinopolymorpha cephalotaxi]
MGLRDILRDIPDPVWWRELGPRLRWILRPVLAPFEPGRRTRRMVGAAAILAVAAVTAVVISPTNGELSSNGPTWPMAAHPTRDNPVSRTNGFYVDPHGQPTVWVRDNPRDPRRSLIAEGIAQRPVARWFLGGWDDATSARQYATAAARAHRLPVLVAYNIPRRDCGGYSAGGASDPAAYRSWIDGLAAGIGSRPAVVVLEPDALAGQTCLPAAWQRQYDRLIAYAVDRFRAVSPGTWVYVDAGHAAWIPPEVMAERLRRAHVANARGFSLNVSNYRSTEANVDYGHAIADALGAKGISSRFLVDTSRNGRPTEDAQWCNPPGQRVGQAPRLGGSHALDMQVWARPPGESDGQCGVGASVRAGEFSPAIAYSLLTETDPPGWRPGLALGLRRGADLWAVLRTS